MNLEEVSVHECNMNFVCCERKTSEYWLSMMRDTIDHERIVSQNIAMMSFEACAQTFLTQFLHTDLQQQVQCAYAIFGTPFKSNLTSHNLLITQWFHDSQYSL